MKLVHATAFIVAAAASALVAAADNIFEKELDGGEILYIPEGQQQQQQMANGSGPNPNRYIISARRDDVDIDVIEDDAVNNFAAKKVKRLKEKKDKGKKNSQSKSKSKKNEGKKRNLLTTSTKTAPAVVEFNSDKDAAEFIELHKDEIIMEVDAPMYLVDSFGGLRRSADAADAADAGAGATAADTLDVVHQLHRELSTSLNACDTSTASGNFPCIPWGIRNVYDDANRSYPGDANGPNLPTSIEHPICIIDSGYLESHTELPPAFNADTTETLPYNEDGCGHGTHVAGTVVASYNGGSNSIGVVGVFPDASPTYIVRAFADNCGYAYTSGLIEAYENCRDAGAKIVSMSLGGYGSSTVMADTFLNGTIDDDMLIIAAAGNHGRPQSEDGRDPTQYLYPASYDSVMSVAAIDNNDNRADFSAYNDQVDIAAPGKSIVSTKNDDLLYQRRQGTSSKFSSITLYI